VGAEVLLEIALEWKGPFGLGTPEQRAAFSPPMKSGVYLWTVANDDCPRISYIGQASNLQERFYQHVFWTLGGAYRLYGEDHLVRGLPPEDIYVPSMENLLTSFLADDSSLRELARKELCTYRFWWATVKEQRVVREAVESALILSAKERGEPIQNPRVSRGQLRSPHLRVAPAFPVGTKIGSPAYAIEYGCLDADAS